MKKLRIFLDRVKPHFQKGGKLYFLHSTFDAFETFLFVPNKVTGTGSHIRDAIDSKRVMSIVLLALIPALLFGILNVGVQHYMHQRQYAGLHWSDILLQVGFWKLFWFGLVKVVPIIIVTYITGLSIEFIFAQVRHHEVNEGFLVSGLLIPLIVPPTIPLWMVAVATAFAVLIGKEAFGGTGMNIMNPALLARAFLFFAYPSHMSGDSPWVVPADVVSGPTPLAVAALDPNIDKVYELYPPIDAFLGFIPGSIGETSTLMILLGAIILVVTGVGSLRIMLSTVVGALFMATVFYLWKGNSYMTMLPWYHLIIGGFAFGTVFMATDPVTAAQTPRGKLIYGFLIGVFTILIRVLNPAYPEGMMLAILLMNVFAPLIDHMVIQRHIRKRMKRLNMQNVKLN
ncbi:MAG: NADH:ubiquinone reductase (Na(+)-transporting) subunit B [Bacteroidales bacterium]|nr:NADH:ubiquinone reductase (Na(+)-transporting) subunit B [Bacteroidales bacterium]